MKRLYPLFLSLIFISNAAFSQVYQAEYADGYLSIKVKNASEVVINEYHNEGTHHLFDSLLAPYGIYLIKHAFRDTNSAALKRCFELRFSDSARMDTLITRLQNYPFIQYVSKNGIGQYYEDVPDDSNYRFQWALQKILADSIWQLLPGDGKQIKIAVIDDAFLLAHQDLAAAIDTNYDDQKFIKP